MGKRKLLTGIIVGASIGGLVSLLNEDARKYAQAKLAESRDSLAYYAKNPTSAINSIRQSVTTFNRMVESNTSGAVHTLEQVEQSLNKVLKK